MNDGDTVPHWRQIAPGIYQVDGLIHWPVFPSRSVRDPRQELADPPDIPRFSAPRSGGYSGTADRGDRQPPTTPSATSRGAAT